MPILDVAPRQKEKRAGFRNENSNHNFHIEKDLKLFSGSTLAEAYIIHLSFFLKWGDLI